MRQYRYITRVRGSAPPSALFCGALSLAVLGCAVWNANAYPASPVYAPQAVAAELRAAANGEGRSSSNYLAHQG